MCGGIVLRGRRPVRVLVVSGCARSMHGTGNDHDSTQRRDPGREENDDQIDGEKSTHHAANLQFANRFRFSKR
jgi:hypothetical protein